MPDTSSPFFSVVIPVYNREGLIHEALDSVFAQTFHDFEVIVVDDGSTDGTVDAVQAYPAPVRIIEQENAGPGVARNTGIEAAEGTYVAFLDSDDRWFPSSLQYYADIIAQYNQPAFVAGCPYVFHDPRELDEIDDTPPSSTYFSDYLASGDEWRWWGVSSFVVKHEALQRVGEFTEKWINAEDADLALRLGTESGFVDVHGAPTFGYRRHDSTAMDDQARTIKGALHNIEVEHKGEYPGGKVRRVERWRILSRHIRPVALQALKHRRFTDAWSIYKDTFRWNLTLRRWKFLLGFPAYAIFYYLKGRIKTTTT